MDVYIESAKAYVYMTTMLCGEVRKRDLVRGDVKAITMRRAIASLRDESKVILETKVDGDTVLRLRKPFAWKIMAYIPELEKQYEAQTNNHRFKSSPPSSVIRELQRGDLIHFMLKNEIHINHTKLYYRSQRGRKKPPARGFENLADVITHGKEGTLDHEFMDIAKNIYISKSRDDNALNYDDLINRILPNELYFFLSFEVKRYKRRSDAGRSPTLSINASRAFGHLVGRENSYSVFMIQDESVKLNRDVEVRFRDYLKNISRGIFGTSVEIERNKYAPKGECILVCPDEKSILKYIREPKKSYRDTNLKTTVADIYSRCYAVTLADSDAINLITQRDWRSRLLTSIFLPAELSGAEDVSFDYCDAVYDDDMAIELVTMDIKKIEATLKLLDKSKKIKLHVFCKDQQKDLAKEIFKKFSKQVIIHVISNVGG